MFNLHRFMCTLLTTALDIKSLDIAHDNFADLLTKSLNGQRHRSLTSYLLFGRGEKFMKGSNSNDVLDADDSVAD